MPHSSGGGSSSGGSHSGSSGSDFSGYGGHGGGGMRRRHSRHYFHGSRCFVCYRDGARDFIYSNYDITRPRSKARFFFLLFFIPFFTGGISLIIQSINIPHRLDLPKDSEIEIVDNYSVFSETDDLIDTLEYFQEQTGITVSIFTTQRDEWATKYGTLERFAYSTYINNYSDEKHWVFVYSNDLDWSWEGMQGNDTDKILTKDLTTSFNKKLTDYFYIGEYSVADSFAMIFRNVTPNIMDTKIDYFYLFFGVAWVIFISFYAYFVIIRDSSKKYRDYQEIY